MEIKGRGKVDLDLYGAREVTMRTCLVWPRRTQILYSEVIRYILSPSVLLRGRIRALRGAAYRSATEVGAFGRN
jgi:hypothetical protein